ncbi:MAG: MFS transporter [Victivallaceae bacterium]|jgi:MFS family permease
MPGRKTFEAAMILAMTGLYFFSFFQRVAIPGAIFNDIQVEFAVSAVEVTRLSAIYLFVYAVMQPFAGLLADRFGGVRVVVVSGILLCAGSLLFPMAQGEWGLYLSRALVGLGASAMYLCLVKESDLYFGGKNYAPILGFLCLLGYCGGLVGTRPFRLLVESIGWRNSCLIVAAASCIVLLLTWLIMQRIGRKYVPQKEANLWGSTIDVLKNSLNYPIIITVSLSFSIYLSFQATIGPKFLEDVCGISPLQSSGYTFIMMLCTMSSLILSGILSKLLNNNRKGFLIFYGAATLAATLMLLTGTVFRASPQFFLVAFILLALAAGTSPVTTLMLKEMNPPEKVAVSIGILNASAYIMVAVMSQVIGRVLDLFKDSIIVTDKARVYPASAYITLFSILLLVALAAAAASFYGRETNGKNLGDCYGRLKLTPRG